MLDGIGASSVTEDGPRVHNKAEEPPKRGKRRLIAEDETREMTKSTGRLILLVAIVGLIVVMFAVQFFLPISGATVQLEEAGLIGALIAGLSSVIGYYFGKD